MNTSEFYSIIVFEFGQEIRTALFWLWDPDLFLSRLLQSANSKQKSFIGVTKVCQAKPTAQQC